MSSTSSAIVITDKTYPLVYVHFQGASTLENTQNFLARFDEWLSCRESFSIILRQTAMENESLPAEEHHQVHRAIAQWAKQNKPSVANYCVGMAMVIDLSEAFEEDEEDYYLSNASTATGTDTPIIETPFSAQVVPQEVIKQQQIVRIEEALNNVSGVSFAGSSLVTQLFSTNRINIASR